MIIEKRKSLKIKKSCVLDDTITASNENITFELGISIMCLKMITSKCRSIEILHRAIEENSLYNPNLSNKIADFILRYLEEIGSDSEAAYIVYEKFITNFNKDIKAYISKGKYPLELGPQEAFERVKYDMVLLISCLVSPHRYQMMSLICEHARSGSDALFIGCGPGLEIDLVASNFKNIHAFDIALGAPPKKLLPKVFFHEELFPSSSLTKEFDAIFLVELLEHLYNPWSVLSDCINVLRPRGQIYMTTATNLPQFDHLYNFPSDHSNFLAELKSKGLSVLSNIEIQHHYSVGEIGAKNHFIVAQKDDKL